MRETWWQTANDLSLQQIADLADGQDVTTAELLELSRSLVELTAALKAFVEVAETFYPHLAHRLPLQSRLRPGPKKTPAQVEPGLASTQREEEPSFPRFAE